MKEEDELHLKSTVRWLKLEHNWVQSNYHKPWTEQANIKLHNYLPKTLTSTLNRDQLLDI